MKSFYLFKEIIFIIKMSISSSIVELRKINNEIKRRSTALRTLRKKKRELEAIILEFLNKNGQNGVKYRNEIAIIKETKKKSNRKYQNHKVKLNVASTLLKNLGIENSTEIAENIIKAMQGPKEDSDSIKIKNIR